MNLGRINIFRMVNDDNSDDYRLFYWISINYILFKNDFRRVWKWICVVFFGFDMDVWCNFLLIFFKFMFFFLFFWYNILDVNFNVREYFYNMLRKINWDGEFIIWVMRWKVLDFLDMFWNNRGFLVVVMVMV